MNFTGTILSLNKVSKIIKSDHRKADSCIEKIYLFISNSSVL